MYGEGAVPMIKSTKGGDGPAAGSGGGEALTDSATASAEAVRVAASCPEEAWGSTTQVVSRGSW